MFYLSMKTKFIPLADDQKEFFLINGTILCISTNNDLKLKKTLLNNLNNYFKILLMFFKIKCSFTEDLKINQIFYSFLTFIKKFGANYTIRIKLII